MAFTTIEFVVFLASVLVIFHIVPRRLKCIWLLATSYYFYADADWPMLCTLVFVTLFTYMGGICIDRAEKYRRALFVVFGCSNVGILLLFKYSAFFVQTLENISGTFAIPFSMPIPEFIAPIGLSFYIFQSTTYLGDIYREKIKPVSLVKYALFVSFFPTVLSGPIQKAEKLLPQFEFSEAFDLNKFEKGIHLVIYGFMVKFFVADALGNVVDAVFDHYVDYSGIYYLMAGICFSFQIYADFLSYSDIAKGISLLLGIEVTKNFNNPYMSTTLSEFWRNWHMSLNEWFVEYIYIPLGGSKKGKGSVNKMIVFLCSGLWHGASWHYVIWGGMNGALQIIGEKTRVLRGNIQRKLGFANDNRVLLWIKRIVVFGLITTTWIFFRMPSVSSAIYVIGNMYRLNTVVDLDYRVWEIWGTVDSAWMLIVALLVFIVVQFCRREGMKVYNTYCAGPWWIKSMIIAICMAILCICLCNAMAQPDKSFIYFQF